jgi:hypothetical protein
MNWSGFYSLASTAMVDPKAEIERLESQCCTKFSDLEVGKIAGSSRRGWINNVDQRIKPTLEPFKLALMKTELEGRVDRRLLSRV